jgi:hypothetical protein
MNQWVLEVLEQKNILRSTPSCCVLKKEVVDKNVSHI